MKTTNTAFYSNEIHYEKRYLIQNQNCVYAFLSKNEFNFIKLNAIEIINNLNYIIDNKNLTYTQCFNQIYNYLQKIMPDFLDGFFGILSDCHLIKTDDINFDKNYFLTHLNDAAIYYSARDLKLNIYDEFPQYVLLQIGSNTKYYYIRQGWLISLIEFFTLFLTTKLDETYIQNLKKHGHFNETITSLTDWNYNEIGWIDYEIFCQVFYSYMWHWRSKYFNETAFITIK